MPDGIELFSCEICGSAEASEINAVRKVRPNRVIHVCCNCGFVYVRERRSADAIARTWSDEMFGGQYTAHIPAVKARQTYVADFIASTIGLKGQKLCDIGAGEGQFLEIAAGEDYGAEIFGVEPSEANCAHMAKKSIPTFCGTIEDYLADGTANQCRFDIVTIMWTLENCRSCRAMVDAAWQILAEGGHIVVATGSRILVPFKKPLHYYISDYSGDTHPSRFSANALHNLLATSGFEEVEVNRYIDTDYLVVAYRKGEKKDRVDLKKDDYREVIDFFERWQVETNDYFADQ